MRRRWSLLTWVSNLILVAGAICAPWWAKPALAGGAVGSGTPASYTGQALATAAASGYSVRPFAELCVLPNSISP